MPRIARIVIALFLALFSSSTSAAALGNPILAAIGSDRSDLINGKQIVRTSTGRIYYFSGNGAHTNGRDGWVMVNTSPDGLNWSVADNHDQWWC